MKSGSSLSRNKRRNDWFARHDSHILDFDIFSFNENCTKRRVIFVDWGGIHSSDAIWTEVFSFCSKTSLTYTYKKREKWVIEPLNKNIKYLHRIKFKF